MSKICVETDVSWFLNDLSGCGGPRDNYPPAKGQEEVTNALDPEC